MPAWLTSKPLVPGSYETFAATAPLTAGPLPAEGLRPFPLCARLESDERARRS